MFNTGVVVTLKSGGPAMTVVQSDHEQNVVCTWFDVNHGVQTASFKAQMLRREAIVKPIRRAA